MKSKIHQWWNIAKDKESYDLYYGIISKRLEDLKIEDPFKLKINESIQEDNKE